MIAAGLKFLKVGLSFLAVGITIPIGVILAAALWVHFDKSSAIRQAVDRAVTELVAGAEKRALEARLAAERQIAEELRSRVAALEAANRVFSEQSVRDQAELDAANDQIQLILSQPVSPDCSVDDAVYNGLRNK